MKQWKRKSVSPQEEAKTSKGFWPGAERNLLPSAAPGAACSTRPPPHPLTWLYLKHPFCQGDGRTYTLHKVPSQLLPSPKIPGNKQYRNPFADPPHTLCLLRFLHVPLLSDMKEGGAEGCLPHGTAPSSLEAHKGVAKQACDPEL